MYTKLDEEDDFIDIIFNGNICSTCIHERNCTMLKLIQIGSLGVFNTEPIIYCCFYSNRTIQNVINWFKKIVGG